MNAIKHVYAKPVLKIVLKSYLSDTAIYKKSVARDCLYNDLQYDKLISLNETKNQFDKGGKVIKVNQERYKLMKTFPGTTRYDIGL